MNTDADSDTVAGENAGEEDPGDESLVTGRAAELDEYIQASGPEEPMPPEMAAAIQRIKDCKHTMFMDKMAQIDLVLIMYDSRFAWLPFAQYFTGIVNGPDMNEVLRALNFDLQPRGNNVSSGSSGKIGCFVPVGWSYSKEQGSGLKDAEGRLIAANVFRPDSKGGRWFADATKILKPQDSPAALIWSADELNRIFSAQQQQQPQSTQQPSDPFRL